MSGVNRTGFRISGIEHIVIVNKDTAITAELVPDIDQVTFLVEDLDSVIAAIRDE